MKLGLLFAGQGSQKPGMGKDFYDNSAEFRKVFDTLSDELKETAFEGPMEKLSYTANTQPIMVAFAAGVMAELNKTFAEAGIRPQMAAGLSLGEYSALHSAGVFDAETAINLVSLRGKAMAEAAEGIECAMTAVLGLDRELLAECCSQAGSRGKVSIANYNCPGQIVIAGEKAPVEEAGRLALEKGAKRCMPLPVSGPFHTEFMKPAGAVLEEVFKETQFKDMTFDVIFNAIGRCKKDEESIAQLLVKQVSSSVYFEDSLKEMEAAGIDTVIEIGPGKALSGFVRKTCKGMKILNIETWEDLQNVSALLKGEMQNEK